MFKMRIKIRDIKKRDYSEVDRLLQQLHKVHMDGRPELFLEDEHPVSVSLFKNLISNKEVISILAEIDHTVIGVCFVSILNTSGMVYMKTGYVEKLVVDEPYRHMGIGKMLLQEAEDRVKKLGAKRMDLMVWNFNETAIHTYESFGMTPQRTIYEKDI